MTEADVDPTVREWLFSREAMRRLGFSPDELFMAVHPAGKVLEGGKRFDFGQPILMLRVEAQGKRWTWTIGPTNLPVEKIRDHFESACALWNAGGFADGGFQASEAARRAVELVAALRGKGFALQPWPESTV